MANVMDTRSVPSVIDLTGDEDNTVVASGSLPGTPNGTHGVSLAPENRRPDRLHPSRDWIFGNAEKNRITKTTMGSPARDKMMKARNEMNQANGMSARGPLPGDHLDRTEGALSSSLPPSMPATCIAASVKNKTHHEGTNGQAASQTGLEKPLDSISSQVSSALREVENIYRRELSKDERRTMVTQIARKLMRKLFPTPKGQSSLLPEDQETAQELSTHHVVQVACEISKLGNNIENKQLIQLISELYKEWEQHTLGGTLTDHNLETEHKRKHLKDSASIQGKRSVQVHVGKHLNGKSNASSPIQQPLRLKRTSDGQVKVAQEEVLQLSPPQGHANSNLSKNPVHENSFSWPPPDASRPRGEARSSQPISQKPRVEDGHKPEVIAYPQMIVGRPSTKQNFSHSTRQNKESSSTFKSSVAQPRTSDNSLTPLSSFTPAGVQLKSSNNNNSNKAHPPELKTRKSGVSAVKDTASKFAATSGRSARHNKESPSTFKSSVAQPRTSDNPSTPLSSFAPARVQLESDTSNKTHPSALKPRRSGVSAVKDTASNFSATSGHSVGHNKESLSTFKSSAAQPRASNIPSTPLSSFAPARVQLESDTNNKVHRSEEKTRKSGISAGKDTASNFATTSSHSTQPERTPKKSEVDHSLAATKVSNSLHTRNRYSAGDTASSVRGQLSRGSFDTNPSTFKPRPERPITLETETEMVLPSSSAAGVNGGSKRPQRQAALLARARTSASKRPGSLGAPSIQGQGIPTRKRKPSTSPERGRADNPTRRQKLSTSSGGGSAENATPRQELPTSERPRRVRDAMISQVRRSYLTVAERNIYQEDPSELDWVYSKLAKGEVRHVDFSPVEMLQLLSIIIDQRHLEMNPICFSHTKADCIECVLGRIIRSVRAATQADLVKIAKHAYKQPGREPNLVKRTPGDILAFLFDIIRRDNSSDPSPLGYFYAPWFCAESKSLLTLQGQAYLREMGFGNARHPPKTVLHDMKTEVYDSLKLWKNWTIGGSSDVMSVMWSPDGNMFAAGCAALTDSENMQYNRNNNLLLGSLSENVIRELPDHRSARTRPESGPNATDDMVNAMDPWLYHTVSAVDFSPSGRRMYTASYDKTVKVWDIDRETARGRLLNTFEHQGVVDIVSTSIHYPALIATGSRTLESSVRIYRIRSQPGSGTSPLYQFCSKKAVTQAPKNIYPSCIRWGPHQSVKHFVLTGYASNVTEEGGRPSRVGDLCLFNVEQQRAIKVTPSAQNVFDCVWHPSLPWFAVGCAADSRANRGTGSYVRLYRSTDKATHELECPALDMNEVTWCPDVNYCTASCTNGNTYVWDIRMHHRTLHTLGHGNPIQELPATDEPMSVRRERYDTGVRFAHWGHTTNRFYTGSSDGVVKVWDIKRATEDVHEKDLVKLDSGVMCGSFTKDHSKLLLGDIQGRLSVLTIQLFDAENRNPRVETFDFERAETEVNDEDPYEAARGMLERGEMVYDESTGLRQVIRGPNYNGPFAADDWAEECRRAQEIDQREFLADKGNSEDDTKEDDSKMESEMFNEDENIKEEHKEGENGQTNQISNEMTNTAELDDNAEMADDDSNLESEVMNGVEDEEGEHKGGEHNEGGESESESDMECDSDGDPVDQPKPNRHPLRHHKFYKLYKFDCGIFPTELLPGDLKKDPVSNDGGYSALII